MAKKAYSVPVVITPEPKTEYRVVWADDEKSARAKIREYGLDPIWSGIGCNDVTDVPGSAQFALNPEDAPPEAARGN